MSEQASTYWNGEPCKAERCTVIVADAPQHEHYWARRFVGQERKAVAVHYNDDTFFLDDEGYEVPDSQIAAMRERFPTLPESFFAKQQGYPGWGWKKVTVGMGGPKWPHASLVIERIVETEHDGAV